MFDEISIHLFCHSLGSLLRLLLRFVNVCSNSAFQDTLQGTVGLADLDGSDGSILLLRLLAKVGYVEKA